MHLITGNSLLVWALKAIKEKSNGPRGASEYGVNGAASS